MNTPPSLAEYSAELKRWGNREINWQLEMSQAVALCGLIQLALRHPGMKNRPSAKLARALIENFVETIPADFPKIRELLMCGFNPACDAK